MDEPFSAKQYAVDYGENANDEGFTMPGQLQSTEDESRYSQSFLHCPFNVPYEFIMYLVFQNLPKSQPFFSDLNSNISKVLDLSKLKKHSVSKTVLAIHFSNNLL